MSSNRLFSINMPQSPNDYEFEVLSFSGEEEIGELFRYEVEIISQNSDIDAQYMLDVEVSLQLHNKDGEDTYIHGVLEYFEAQQEIGKGYILYKACLVPKLWWLSVAKNQLIFLNKSVIEILESTLIYGHFTKDDYEFRLHSSYETREYVCQYEESHYDFFRRWMQREGIYFFFEQNVDGCKLVITDANDKHRELEELNTMLYRPNSGLQEFNEQAVSNALFRSKNTIKSVRMKNYNPDKPSLEINTYTQSSLNDPTKTYLYGNNTQSIEESKRLTVINEEKFKCTAQEMLGDSNIVSLIPGYIYTLNEYFKAELNQQYIMVKVHSNGSQKAMLSNIIAADDNETSFYQNEFIMIPSTTQYRMQSSTPWPKISGMLSATIDGAGSGEVAELDKHGRYKVIMPFDLSGREHAKASMFLRMAQPSAGGKQGMHFPLHKGTEVLIAFKNGDPDQPIIASAVPNIDTPSPVNEKNITQSVITTASGLT
ncbi:MAG: type VI secretion system tip protein TssI/VgrG, partial [Campylobacterota bacterium]|nr:type VI secretion system tip protein TssI/VgrG [Campylobacterota bacterium]